EPPAAASPGDRVSRARPGPAGRCARATGRMSRWIHGLHAVLEALEATPDQVTRVVAAERPGGRHDARLQKIVDAAKRAGVPFARQPASALERLAGEGAVHQGVLALVAEATYADPDQVIARAPSPALVLVLDGVEDPRNLGAAI